MQLSCLLGKVCSCTQDCARTVPQVGLQALAHVKLCQLCTCGARIYQA